MKLADLLKEGKGYPRGNHTGARRFVSDLTKEEQRIIVELGRDASNIKSVKVVDEWNDDHLPCVGVKINGVEMGFWWLSNAGVSNLYKPTSAGAKAHISEMIRDQIDIAKDDDLWKIANDPDPMTD